MAHPACVGTALFHRPALVDRHNYDKNRCETPPNSGTRERDLALKPLLNFSKQACIFLNRCSVNLIDDYFLNTDRKESLMAEIEKTL